MSHDNRKNSGVPKITGIRSLAGGEKIHVGSLGGLPVAPGTAKAGPGPNDKAARQMTPAEFDAAVREAAKDAPIQPLSLPADQVMPVPEGLTPEEAEAHRAWVAALKALAAAEAFYQEMLKFRMSPRIAAALKDFQVALGLPDPPPMKDKGVIITNAKKFFKGLGRKK